MRAFGQACLRFSWGSTEPTLPCSRYPWLSPPPAFYARNDLCHSRIPGRRGSAIPIKLASGLFDTDKRFFEARKVQARAKFALTVVARPLMVGTRCVHSCTV